MEVTRSKFERDAGLREWGDWVASTCQSLEVLAENVRQHPESREYRTALETRFKDLTAYVSRGETAQTVKKALGQNTYFYLEARLTAIAKEFGFEYSENK